MKRRVLTDSGNCHFKKRFCLSLVLTVLLSSSGFGQTRVAPSSPVMFDGGLIEDYGIGQSGQFVSLPLAPSTNETIDESNNKISGAVDKKTDAEEKQAGTEEKRSSDSKDGAKSDKDADADEKKDLTKDLEKRLKDLEKKFADQADKEKAAKADAKKKPTFKLGGRIHLDQWSYLDQTAGIGYFEHSDPTASNFGADPEDRTQFRRVRLEMQGDIPQNMLWRMQIDFNDPSALTYKDVYFGWKELPGNQTLLLGNQKRPMGLDHLNSSRFNVFAERPLVVESFNEDARRIGLCMYGHTSDEYLNWRYGVFNLENTSDDGTYIGDSLQLGTYGRLAATPWYDEASGGRGYYHWGISGAVARPDGNRFNGDTNANEARFRTRAEARSDQRWFDTGRIAGAEWFEIIGLESVLNLGRFQLTTEYMANFVQRNEVTPGTGNDLFLHGMYVYGSYFLTGEHMPWERSSGTLNRVKPFENFFLIERMTGGTGRGWGALQLAARYDYIDLTDNDIRGGVANAMTLGLNWYWNAYSKLQTNLIYGDVNQHRTVAGFDSGNYLILGTRYMCDF